MSLKFIYGLATTNYQKILLDQAIEWLQKDKNYKVFYLVPNHIKFETEISVLKGLKNTLEQDYISTINLQIFSFSRLSWYFLQHHAEFNKQVLSETGKFMLIKYILQTHKESLTLLRGESEKRGFVEYLINLFNEFEKSEITPDMLNIESLHLEDLNDSLDKTLFHQYEIEYKLKDIILIYQLYLNIKDQKQLRETNPIQLLIHYLEYIDLSNICFIIQGFSYFSNEEKRLLELLISKSNVIIHLTLDHKYIDNLPEKNHIFYDSGKLYYHFYHYARAYNIPIYQDINLNYLENNNTYHKDIIYLGDAWLNSNINRENDQTLNRINIWQATTRYAEIMHICNEIKRLVVENNYRYKDIQIITRNIDQYQLIFQQIFSMNKIPFVITENQKITHHPLIEWISSLFKLNKRFYQHNDMMNFLKTELFYPQIINNYEDWKQEKIVFRKELDILENFLLSQGIYGKQWISKTPWQYYQKNEISESDQQVLNIVNNYHSYIVDLLPTFFKDMNQANSAFEMTQIFYQFLHKCGVIQQITYWKQQAIQDGKLDIADMHEKTWDTLINVLDEFVMLFQDEYLTIEDFEEILLTGLSNIKYGHIPQTLDQVTIYPYDNLALNPKKITFIIGYTDHDFPKKIENRTLLTDEERLFLEQNVLQDTEFYFNTLTNLYRENYQAYLSFQSATDYLYITYPYSVEELKDINMSPYLNRVKQIGNININIKTLIPKLTHDIDNTIMFINTYRSLISLLIILKRNNKENNKLTLPFWRALEKELMQKSDYVYLYDKVQQSLTYKNIPTSVSKELVENVYGKNLYTSVSRIEEFYDCQYKYFLANTLNVKPRAYFEYTPIEAGNYYHDALDLFYQLLHQYHIHLEQLSNDEYHHIIKEVFHRLEENAHYNIFKTSARMNFIQKQLQNTIKTVIRSLYMHSHHSQMKPYKTEAIFGMSQGEAKFLLPIDQKHQLNLRGKIDRIDYVTDQQNNMYVSVVDYKSKKHQLSYNSIYEGLSIQLVSYLDVVLTNANLLKKHHPINIFPAGAFYLTVTNPKLPFKAKENQQKRQINFMKHFKYQGLCINDPEVLELMDQSYEDKNSLIYPISTKAEKKQLLNEQEFKQVLQYNRHLLIQAGKHIYEGDVLLNPVKSNTHKACDYCEFKSICQFDAMLPENNYRCRMKRKLDKDTFIDMINNHEYKNESIDKL